MQLIFQNVSYCVYNTYLVPFAKSISIIWDWKWLFPFKYWPILLAGGHFGKWPPQSTQDKFRMTLVFKMTFMVSNMSVPSFMLFCFYHKVHRFSVIRWTVGGPSVGLKRCWSLPCTQTSYFTCPPPPPPPPPSWIVVLTCCIKSA